MEELVLCITRLFGEDPTSGTSLGQGGFLAAPTQPGGHQCLQGFMGSQAWSWWDTN